MIKLSIFSPLFLIITLTANAKYHEELPLADIATGDPNILKQLPDIVKRVNPWLTDEQSGDLSVAIGFALIKDPIAVLKVTNSMEKDKDTLVQRFGSGLVCALPTIVEYTRDSNLKYYHLVTESLKKAGEPAKECLDLMRATMIEVEVLDGRGEMKWGKKVY